MLTHQGRVTHICVGNLTIIGSDNGLTPGRRQAITWTNAVILLIGPLVTNFSEISIRIQTFSFKKMHLRMSTAKWRPFCLGPNVLSCFALPVTWLCQLYTNTITLDRINHDSGDESLHNAYKEIVAQYACGNKRVNPEMSLISHNITCKIVREHFIVSSLRESNFFGQCSGHLIY